MKCDICEEVRGIQECHIISRKLDFALKKAFVLDNEVYTKRNTLNLCPNHHWYFDHNLLSEEELAKISNKIFYMVKAINKAIDIFTLPLNSKEREDYKKIRTQDILWNKTLRERFKNEFKTVKID